MAELIFAVLLVAGATIVLAVWMVPRVVAAFSEGFFEGADPTPEQVADIAAMLNDTGEINRL